MSKKSSPNLAGLVATKGTAVPTKSVPTRPEAMEEEGNSLPLNFKVPGEFRKRFKTFAAQNDMKLNQLLYAAFDAYENAHKQ